MKAFWLVVPLLILGGCKQDNSTAYVNVHMGELSPPELVDLVGPGLDVKNAIMLVKRDPKDPKTHSSDLMFIFNDYHFSGKLGYLRNPDVVVAVLTSNADAKPITDKDRELVARIAKDRGLEVDSDFKLEAVMGPDGKTPMVLPLKTAKTAISKPGTIMTIIAFPDQKAAETAKLYIDKAYQVEIRHEPKPLPKLKPGETLPPAAGKDWTLTAQLKGDVNSANVEMDEFGRLADKFGGVLLSTSAY